MNFFKKILNGVNPDEDEAYEDVFNDDEIYGGGDGSFGNAGDISDFMQAGGGNSPYGNQSQNVNPQQAPPPYQQAPAAASGAEMIPVTGGSMQYSTEVKLVKPEDYGNPNQIADHVINRRTVILNMEETSKETARRLLDYLNGVAYAIQGQVKKVSEKTFVIAPKSILLSSDKTKEETRKDSDSNESIY